MISQNRGGLPIFLADLGVAVADGIARYGLDGFAPGDVVVMNQAEVCGQHLNNVVVYSPCFHNGEVVGFAANRAHWVDIGGMHQGFGSTAANRHLLRRLADPLAQDLRGRQAQRDALADHPRQRALSGREPRRSAGADRLLPARRAPLCRADRALWPRDGGSLHRQGLGSGREQAARQVVETIPDGVYEAESFLDNDGRTLDKPLRVKVTVRVKGSQMTVDFSEMNPQVPIAAQLRPLRRHCGGARRLQGADLARSRRQRRLLPPARSRCCPTAPC